MEEENNKKSSKKVGIIVSVIVISDDEDEQLLTINMIENVENRGGSHYLLPKVKNIIEGYIS